MGLPGARRSLCSSALPRVRPGFWTCTPSAHLRWRSVQGAMLPVPMGTSPPRSSPLASRLDSPVRSQRRLEGFIRLSLEVLWHGLWAGGSVYTPWVTVPCLEHVCARRGRRPCIRPAVGKYTWMVPEPRGCRGPCWPPAPPVPGHVSACAGLGWPRAGWRWSLRAVTGLIPFGHALSPRGACWHFLYLSPRRLLVFRSSPAPAFSTVLVFEGTTK